MQRLDVSGRGLPNFVGMDAIDATIYGSHNKVKSINPFNTYFIAQYPNGKIIQGKNLFETGWDAIPNGLSKLSYNLSTGHVIEIPRFKAYLPMIEVSVGLDGSRIFHAINVNCMADKEVVIYKIVLRQDNISKWNIGDVVISKVPKPKEMYASWKYTS